MSLEKERASLGRERLEIGNEEEEEEGGRNGLCDLRGG